MENKEEISKALNKLYQMNNIWGLYSNEESLSERDILLFRSLTLEFIELIDKQTLADALRLLTQMQDMIAFASHDSDKFRSFGFSQQELEEISPYLNKPGPSSNASIDANQRVRFEHQKIVDTHLKQVNGEELFASFCKFEMDLLKAAGCDQRSIAILMEYLQRKKMKILSNVIKQTRLQHGICIQKIEKIESNANKIDGTKNRKNLGSIRKLKPWIIGVSVCWANALPVLIAADWGAASVLSGAAGATVAAIIPSGERD